MTSEFLFCIIIFSKNQLDIIIRIGGKNVFIFFIFAKNIIFNLIAFSAYVEQVTTTQCLCITIHHMHENNKFT